MISPTLSFTDSADHYQAGQLGYKWSSGFNAAVTTQGRKGNGIQLTPGFISPGSITISLFPTGFWQIGFAINIGFSSGIIPGSIIFNATQSGQSVFICRILNDSTLGLFTAGSPENLIGLGPILHQSTWHYIEMIVGTSVPNPRTHPLDPITVIAGLRFDGKIIFEVTFVASSTLAGTFISGNDSIDALSVSSGNQGAAIIDDFYCFPASGSSVMADTFGDVSIVPSFPIADTANTDPSLPGRWHPLPSPPAPHFSLVNDDPPDFGTSVISLNGLKGGTFRQRVALDAYVYDPINVNDKLFAVNMLFMGDGANEVIDPVVGIQPTFFIGGDLPGKFGLIWGFLNQVFTFDPYTGIAWTPANYNSYHMGVFYSFTNTT